MQSAAKAHVNYLKVASNGRGCDRHMLGLRMMLRDNEKHPVFTDEAFGSSQTWRLSTSGLTTGDKLLSKSRATACLAIVDYEHINAY